ncbi:MAG: hypothetical protein IID14_01430 [Candidatus Marinimicrobia bacterium]|nr:hypothetical protein [Candidatus Neomarinimicrobiota bacterium]
MGQRDTQTTKGQDHLRRILLQLRDAMAAILDASRKLLDEPGRLNVDKFEDLLQLRATYLEQFKELDSERRQLMKQLGDQDGTAQLLSEEIQASIQVLATLDTRLKDRVLNAQMMIINSMAITPKFVNFSQSTGDGTHANRFVVDITR